MTRGRSAGARTATTVLVVFGLVVSGCTDGTSSSRPTPTVGITSGSPDLDRAVSTINATRGALVADMNTVIAAANAVDAIDRASSTGDTERARRARNRQDLDVPAVNVVVARLPSRVRAYAGAVDALAGAARRRAVPFRLAAAVRQVAAAGRAEVDAAGAFVRSVAQAWPAYAVLAGLQSLWFQRATSDWYADRDEARDAYTVLTVAKRPTTERASKLFASADAARRGAAQTWADTLEQQRPVLEAD